MTYGSICSGIESVSVAWKPLGMKCAFMSEIDKFPCAVLRHRFPDVPLHGDFTTIQRGDYGAIDVLVGGTPCQSFSVAGLRAGLADPRGNLMLGFGALAKRLAPQWLVWENVPGVLSSNGGRDFGTFLGMLAQLGYGFAYRVLDAQYIRVQSHPRAVPQRRRRVFVVGYFGDWRPAAQVLFELASLQGYPPPRREAGEGITHPASPCIGASGRGFERTGETRGQDAVIAANVASPLMNGSGNPAGHNSRSGHCKDSHIVPVVSPAMKSRDCKGPSSDGDGDGDGLPLVCHTLRAEHDASEDGTGRGTPLVAQTVTSEMYRSRGATEGNNTGVRNVLAFAQNQRNEVREMEVAGAIPAIRRGDAKNETLLSFKSGQGSKARSLGASSELSPTLGSAESGTQLAPALLHNMAVRRLTPRECERLQGFPDDWTLIPWRGKSAEQCPDGPRYKALGNAMAVNVMAWIGQRIVEVSHD